MTDMTPKTYSLLELAQGLERMFQKHWSQYYWVRCEINKLGVYKHSGHAYPDLVEKNNGQVVVEMRGMIWKSDLLRIQERFRHEVKEELKDGMKMLCYGRLRYSPRHGISLEIKDIDPSYSLGDLEQEKKVCIIQLQQQGLWKRNASLKLPLLPQRLAIISVESSKGYQDFIHVLHEAQMLFGFHFFHHLFPALLQGDKAVDQITHQLQRVASVAKHFDAVLIIRGGGGDIGLSCYNHLQLCTAIANCPIPVLTGIGHATNQTVAEMVAHTSAITPTKLAEKLLDQFHFLADQLSQAKETLQATWHEKRNASRQRIHQTSLQFQWQARMLLQQQGNELRKQGQELVNLSRSVQVLAQGQLRQSLWKMQAVVHWRMRDEAKRLHTLQLSLPEISLKRIKDHHDLLHALAQMVQAYDPQQVLARGYSITTLNGKAVMGAHELKEGDTLITQFAEGRSGSIVQWKKIKE